MSAKGFLFEEEQLNRLFPFFILVDRSLNIISSGTSIGKVFNLQKGRKLSDFFRIHTPDFTLLPFESLSGHTYQLLANPNDHEYVPLVLQGELEYLKANDYLLFLGSPRLNSIVPEQKDLALIANNSANDYIFGHVHLSSDNINTKPPKVASAHNVAFDIEENIKGIAITDAKGSIEWVDSEFERTSGYKLDEIHGMRPREVIYGKDSTHIPRSYVDEMVKQKKPFSFINIGYNKSGKSFWFKATIQPIIGDNKEVKGRYYFFEDITESRNNEIALKESLELWKSAVDGAGDGVWYYNLHQQYIQVSQKLKEILGYGFDDTFGMYQWQSVIGPENYEIFLENVIPGLAEDCPTFSVDFRLRNKNGNYKFYRVRGKVIQWDREQRPIFIFGTVTDINEEKLKDIKIEEQRKYYHRILDELPVDIVIISPDHKFEFINRVAVKNNELREWLIGKDMFDYCRYKNMGMEFAERREAQYAEAIQARKPKRTIEKFVVANSADKYMLRELYPFFDLHGNVEYLVAFGVDITEQVNNENKLKEQREYYNEILNEIPADIVIFSLDHKYKFINKSAVKDPEVRAWLLDKDDYDYCTFRNLDISFADKRRRTFHEAVTTKRSVSLIDEIRRRDGTNGFNLRFMYPLMNESGTVKFVIGYGVDITEQVVNKKNAELHESRIRRLLDIIRDGVFSWDEDGTIKFFNNSFLHILNINSEASSNLNFYTFFDKTELQKLKADIVELKRTGIAQSNIVYFINSAGVKKYLDYTLSPAIQNENVDFVGRISDITEIINREDSLNEIISKEKELNDAKSKFIRITSHELRTPLAIILANAEILEMIQNKTTPGMAQLNPDTMTKRILKEVTLMTELLDELMLVSKIESGNIDFDRENIRIKAFIDDILIDLYNPYADGRVLNVELEPGVINIIADKGLLRQALFNIINNAFKYSPGKPAPVLRIKDKGDVVLFEVEDFGIGIPEREQNNLFKSFFRASNTTAFSGNGLGLTVLEYVVSKHKGEVYFESKENVGSLFSFTLPKH